MDVRTRTLRNLCEPIGANVYFAPEAQARYRALGLDYMSAYFCSRGAALGQPNGWTVVAAFGVFSPDLVLPAVEAGWSRTEPGPLLAARYDGAVASLRRLLGAVAEAQVLRAVDLLRRGLAAAEAAGHPLFAGLKSLPWPGEPLGQLWRCCDMVREHRGDSHIAVWTLAGLRPVEIQLISEIEIGLKPKTFSLTRGWTIEQMDAALDTMRARGWLTGHELTAEGRAMRERIESDTDDMETPLVDAIGDDFDELCAILRPWAAAIVAAGVKGGGYPGDPRAIADLAASAP